MWNMNDVKEIVYKEQYFYRIVFDDGKSGDVDFSAYLDSGPVFEPLHWRKEYNEIRPHSSLGYRPPAPKATVPLYNSLNTTLTVVH